MGCLRSAKERCSWQQGRATAGDGTRIDYHWQNLLTDTESQAGSITGGSRNQCKVLKVTNPHHWNDICQALH